VVRTVKTNIYQVTEHSQVIALSLEIPWNSVRTSNLMQIEDSMYLKLDIFSHQYEAETMLGQEDQASADTTVSPKNRWDGIEKRQIYSILHSKSC